MSTRPTMQTFIDDNREEIDAIITQQWPGLKSYGMAKLDDDERENWILNFEPLYMLASQAGVDV